MRAPRFRPLPALAIALALLGLASCSSDGNEASRPSGGDSTTSTTTPTDPRLDLRGPKEVTGPIEGGKYGVPSPACPRVWKQYGYTEDEYFIAATRWRTDRRAAHRRRQVGGGTHRATTPYKTRMIVRHPVDPADFNGTLVVEWLNVTAGRDADPEFGYLADELLTQGYAYAAVSAQRIGVEPGGLGIEVPGAIPEALQPLKDWDPERYGELDHPGDTWSTHLHPATRFLFDRAADAPMGGLVVDCSGRAVTMAYRLAST
jgi:hypothetical protein